MGKLFEPSEVKPSSAEGIPDILIFPEPDMILPNDTFFYDYHPQPPGYTDKDSLRNYLDSLRNYLAQQRFSVFDDLELHLGTTLGRDIRSGGTAVNAALDQKDNLARIFATHQKRNYKVQADYLDFSTKREKAK